MSCLFLFFGMRLGKLKQEDESVCWKIRFKEFLFDEEALSEFLHGFVGFIL